MTTTRADTDTPAPPSGRLPAWWSAITAAIGTVVGLAPHVLHHVGLLAGTALVAGTGGTILFGALGLLASIPLLLRLRRRFHSWWAPLIGLAVFAAMFSLSPRLSSDQPSAAPMTLRRPRRQPPATNSQPGRSTTTATTHDTSQSRSAASGASGDSRVAAVAVPPAAFGGRPADASGYAAR